MDGDLEIIFRQSAFSHGVTEADIRWAFNTVESDELIQGFDNKYRLLGFNTKGNMIEVLYNMCVNLMIFNHGGHGGTRSF